MEQREELKNSVKQRLIEFMAEQITKEEGFVDLKNELIKEIFYKKEIEPFVIENLESLISTTNKTPREEELEKTLGFSFNSSAIENRIKKIAEERGMTNNFIAQKQDKKEVIAEIKSGKLAKNLKGFTEDSSNEPGLQEILAKLRTVAPIESYNSRFEDYTLKYTESDKSYFRKQIVDFIKNNETKFWVETFKNDPNYYKKYSIGNSTLKLGADGSSSLDSAKNDFKLNISYIYNDATKSYFIDNFDCTLNSLYMMNKDLGLKFSVEILQMMSNMEKEDNAKFTESAFTTKPEITSKGKIRKPRKTTPKKVKK